MARRVSLRARVLALAVAGSALTTGVLAGTPSASAQNIKAQIASAQAQLRQLNNQAEAASERYNAARIKLETAQQHAAGASKQLSTATKTVTRLEYRAASFAVAAYKGDTTNSLTSVVAGTTQQLLNRDSALQAIATTQSAALASVATAKRGQEQAQANASAALAEQRTATAAMAAQRNQVIAAANKEQQILKGLQAKEAALIKAAKARAARLAAQRAAAALAAQRAAAAAAAKAVAAQPVSQPAPAPQPAPHPAPHVSASGGAATAVAWAYQEIGKPYVWGAAGPNSFDCSGLAQYVWSKAGVYLAHYTGSQWNEGTHVDRSQLQPGDLVFFAYNTSNPSTIHHVGIYIGGGEMIDAPYTGVDVRKDPAFRSDYIGAVRP
jgi:peptidoglycan DL-endopeptidase CwlO